MTDIISVRSYVSTIVLPLSSSLKRFCALPSYILYTAISAASMWARPSACWCNSTFMIVKYVGAMRSHNDTHLSVVSSSYGCVLLHSVEIARIGNKSFLPAIQYVIVNQYIPKESCSLCSILSTKQETIREIFK